MTRKQVSIITGIPDRRVLFYTEQGILKDFNKNTGRGSARHYSEHDVHILNIIKRLSVIGFELKKIKEIIK